MTKIQFIGVIVIGSALLLGTSLSKEEQNIAYWQEPTIKSSLADEPLVLQSIEDTTSAESIFLQKTKENIPLFFFKKIVGEVCSSKECRLLDIEIYWNITGRYLGFKLPKGEYLSKNDHEPFTEKEYLQLHSILADESLPLDKVSSGELLQKPELGVDAISGATSKSIVDMVVKGAAYTTFKLWNVVNGSTMDKVAEFTAKQLNPDLLYRILQSKNVADKLWALNRINSSLELTTELETKLLEIIASDDFSLSLIAIKVLSTDHLKSNDLQNKLFSIYSSTNHSKKTAILKKLEEATFLSQEIIKSSRQLLPELNGQQLKGLFQLYRKQQISDKETYLEVAKMLQNENKYISKTAYDFLMGQKTDYDDVIESLKAYEREKL